jgi:hypothetical protein
VLERRRKDAVGVGVAGPDHAAIAPSMRWHQGLEIERGTMSTWRSRFLADRPAGDPSQDPVRRAPSPDDQIEHVITKRLGSKPMRTRTR